jgi:hypothetical protein
MRLVALAIHSQDASLVLNAARFAGLFCARGSVVGGAFQHPRLNERKIIPCEFQSASAVVVQAGNGTWVPAHACDGGYIFKHTSKQP